MSLTVAHFGLLYRHTSSALCDFYMVRDPVPPGKHIYLLKLDSSHKSVALPTAGLSFCKLTLRQYVKDLSSLVLVFFFYHRQFFSPLTRAKDSYFKLLNTSDRVIKRLSKFSRFSSPKPPFSKSFPFSIPRYI